MIPLLLKSEAGCLAAQRWQDRCSKLNKRCRRRYRASGLVLRLVAVAQVPRLDDGYYYRYQSLRDPGRPRET
jgi:hypothetical protein